MVKTTILGSREHFCINSKVRKIKETNRQAHVCRAMVSKRTCNFYNKYDAVSSEKMAEYLEKGHAMDIEEFVRIGNSYAMCPYYMSRQRSETSELILLPYNYVIDPKMRRRYKLDLKNSIVIFDEAHNLESICEANASAELTSTVIAMCIEELKKVLALLVEEEEESRAEGDITTEAFGSQKPDPGKKLIENLRTEDLMTVLEKLFKLEEEFEATWNGEDLKAVASLDGKASDGEVLLKIFEKVGFNVNSTERIVDIMRNATSYLLSKGEEIPLTEKGDGMEKVCDFILSIFSTHAQEVAAAVGDSSIKLADKIDPRLIARNCKLYMNKENGSGKLHIKYFCFQASISMRMLKMRGVRNVLLASGTLSPIQSFTFNMGLNFGAILENEHALKKVPVSTSIVTRGYRTSITGTFANRANLDYIADVGETLIRVLDETPQGVIVFFSSYSQMDELIGRWKNGKRANNTESFWEKMGKSKSIVVEPRAKDELVAIRTKYVQGVRNSNGAAFFAVCRGKVSEGIDFCDAESRAVVIIGIPYPPVNDERVVLKRMFLDDMMGRKENERQSSRDWYQMEAFRAVNQAIGRVLRHKADFGAVVLVDSRYASAKLEMFPKWLRSTICRGDTKECAARLARFFGERKGLIAESKTFYSTKQDCKKAAMFKQKKMNGMEIKARAQMSMDELFAGCSGDLVKEEISLDKEEENQSGFLLPTDETEQCRKNAIAREERVSFGMKPKTGKRTIGGEESVAGNCSKKKKLVLVPRRNRLEQKYEEALKIPTSCIIQGIEQSDKKVFAGVLKEYKSQEIVWNEVFDRLYPIFVPKRPDLFIKSEMTLRLLHRNLLIH